MNKIIDTSEVESEWGMMKKIETIKGYIISELQEIKSNVKIEAGVRSMALIECFEEFTWLNMGEGILNLPEYSIHVKLNRSLPQNQFILMDDI